MPGHEGPRLGGLVEAACHDHPIGRGLQGLGQVPPGCEPSRGGQTGANERELQERHRTPIHLVPLAAGRGRDRDARLVGLRGRHRRVLGPDTAGLPAAQTRHGIPSQGSGA